MGARPWPWVLIFGGLLIAALVAGVVYFQLRLHGDAREREHHGVVTVDFCHYRGRSNDTADCVGTFRSDDGALIVPGVRISFIGVHQDMRRHDTAPATLAGPDDDTADPDEHVFAERFVFWILDLVLFAWLVAQLVWFFRELRRQRQQTSPR